MATKDFGVIYAHGKQLSAWINGVNWQFRTGNDKLITAVTVRERDVYFATDDGRVQTLSGSLDAKNEFPVSVFGMLAGRLVAIGEGKRGEHRPEHYVQLYDVANGTKLLDFPCRGSDETFVRTFPGLAITNNDKIYISGQRVLKTRADGTPRPVTGRLSDFSHVVTDGEDIYVVYVGKDHDAEIVHILPKKRLGFFKESSKNLCDDGEDEQTRRKGYGYPNSATMFGDTFIIGTTNMDSQEDQDAIYAIKITKGMLKSENGVKTRPELLTPVPYSEKPYGMGIPMAAVPVKDLELILQPAQVVSETRND